MAEGTPELGCSWDVGSPFDAGTGSLGLQDLSFGRLTDEMMAEQRDFALDPVDIEGLGDDAFFEYEFDEAAGLRQSTSRLTFSPGDLVLKLETNFFGRELDPQEEQQKLETLAEQALGRLEP